MKTANLTGVALDWAVAKCEGHQGERFMQIFKHQSKMGQGYCYSRDWAQGGPIIERERIELRDAGGDGWAADDNLRATQYGETPLEAAMRCYVASKLGDEVELPEGLTHE